MDEPQKKREQGSQISIEMGWMTYHGKEEKEKMVCVSSAIQNERRVYAIDLAIVLNE